MAEQPWQEIRGADGSVLGWMQPPDPATGKYDGDTRPVAIVGPDGDPVAMTNVDVDPFTGQLDDDAIPGELYDLGELGFKLHFWDDAQ